MRLTGPARVLADAFSIVGAAINRRTPKEALLNARCTAKGGTLTLQATDVDNSITVRVDGIEVDGDADVLIRPDTAQKIFHELGDTACKVEISAGAGAITAGRDAFKVQTAAPDDFPQLPGFDGKGAVSLGVTDFRAMLKRTRFATAREELKYALNGILINIKKGIFEFVASDTKRLAYAKRTGKHKKDFPDNVILPEKGLALVESTLTNADETIEIEIDDAFARFKTARATVALRRLDGMFPAFKQFIPKDLPRKATIGTSTFEGALRKSAITTSIEARVVSMKFEDNTLTLASRSGSEGESTVVADCEVKGDAVTFLFDPQFFQDVLRVVEGDTVTLEMGAPESPVILTDDPDFLYLVMPVVK
jgi:DNA polymerase-3 subunit beta